MDSTEHSTFLTLGSMLGRANSLEFSKELPRLATVLNGSLHTAHRLQLQKGNRVCQGQGGPKVCNLPQVKSSKVSDPFG